MYNNYEGDYLEGFVLTAKVHMSKTKKYKSFKLRLLTHHDKQSMKSELLNALEVLKQDDFYHYKTSRKYVNINDASDILDKCLATDDILYNEETNTTVSIDWTSSVYKITDKVEKHKMLSNALFNIADFQIVVCIQNTELWEKLDEADLAKSMYTVLKLINNKINEKDYAGFIIIDVKDII